MYFLLRIFLIIMHMINTPIVQCESVAMMWSHWTTTCVADRVTFNFAHNDTNTDMNLHTLMLTNIWNIYLTQGWNIFACLLVPCVKIISQILNAADYWKKFFINIMWKAYWSHLITQEPLNTTIVIKLLYVENFNNFKNVNI